MLQNIRQSTKGTAAKIVIWLIVLSFALFGIESILLGGSSSEVAEVNGEPIGPMEVQQAVNTQRRQLIAMMGEDIDPAMLDEQRLSSQALQGIISRRLLGQAAESMDLTVSEAELGRVVASMEQFQFNGAFSPEVYKNVLASAGFTPASFKASLQEDMMLNQLRSGFAGSEFATPAELALAARVIAEQRDIRYLSIPLESVKTDVQVTDADVEQYYADNEADFYSRETVVLNYIELERADFVTPVDESELRSMYESEKNSYQYQTENRVSHILLIQGEQESDDAFASRLDTVQQALDNGQAFADVASEFSDDVGSAGFGGDLGFSSGDAFPEEMEEAIADLELNTVSEPVETDAGTHLIMVTERREGEPPSFAEMRPELEQRLQERDAAAALLLAVEDLRDRAFNAQDLQGPAEELDLEVERSGPVHRDQADGLFANPTLLSAAFSEDVLSLGHNSEVIELNPSQFVVLRVHEHQPPALRPLEEVRERIVAAITDEAAREAVSEQAMRAVARLREGESVETVAGDLGYEWQVEIGADQRSMMLPPVIQREAFRLPAPEGDEAVVDFALNQEGDAEVFAVSRVTPGDVDSLQPQERRMLRQQIGAEYGQLVQEEYQQSLRAEADITVF